MDTLNYPKNFDIIDSLENINTIKDLIMLEYDVWNFNEPFIITIETDIYGKIKIDGYINLENKIDLNDLNYEFFEIINDVDFSTVTTKAANQNDRYIEVENNDFLINDIIRIKDTLYRINDINENILKLDKGLTENIDSNENVELQGNTGIYKLIINDKIDLEPETPINIILNLIINNEIVTKTINTLYTNRYTNTIIQAVI